MTNFENLKIDYFSLNLQFNNIKQIKRIAGFLTDLGCKSTLVDKSSGKRYLPRSIFYTENIKNRWDY